MKLCLESGFVDGKHKSRVHAATTSHGLGAFESAAFKATDIMRAAANLGSIAS